MKYVSLGGFKKIIPVLAIFPFVLTGCTSTSFHTHQACSAIPQQTQVLVMPMDIQLFELTAGGLEEPRADWTLHAKKYFMNALHKKLETTKDAVVLYEPPYHDYELTRVHQQITKLHETVGNAILVHTYLPYAVLPTKKDTFDWSLGENVHSLRNRYKADYAMFILIRDSYNSGGRTALIIGAAILGASVPGGQQRGFASLVDLNTGRIVWFNRLQRDVGDLRTPVPAHKTMQYLLQGCPL